MENRFTDSARKALDNARAIAKSMNHNYVGTEHLLLALIKTPGVASKILKVNHVAYDDVCAMMDELIAPGSNLAVMEEGEFTPRAQKVIDASAEEAENLDAEEIGTEHLLMALVKEQESIAVRLMLMKEIDMQKICTDIIVASGQQIPVTKDDPLMKWKKDDKGKTPTLDRFSTDLTALARDGKLDPVIGRDVEIQRLVQILGRRTKNNPCLIGEPGVGKTAVVEGLAQKIVEEDIPETLVGRRVVNLDLSGMVAGTKYRGEFEERIKKIIDEVIAQKNILVFIDEIHTIIGAGGAEGSLDAANILKPSLARGRMQVIGATTVDEYRKYIEKDAALERRFQSVMVEEPDEAQSIEILQGLAKHYEDHHHVKISAQALVAAVHMSARYINDRFLPDKAIDVMDEACSRVGLKRYVPTPELRQMEEDSVRLEKEMEDAVCEGDYARASEARKRREQVLEQLKELREKKDRKSRENVPEIGENDIAAVIAEWTKIPVQKLQEQETQRLRRLEEILHRRVVGQSEAVTAVSRAVRRGRVGLKDPNRPIGSFLFLGPTGVGKTELSKALAEAVFGQEQDIIRVDMSEYMEKHSVSKMIGSPPGYVGYEEGGQLSEKVRRHPYSVVLFDEIEKAHPDVFNLLLQILEDGHVTDSQGRRVSFKNTIIIMTSNAGAQQIMQPKHLGFVTGDQEKEDYLKMKEGVMEEVRRIFKPEFINRIDEVLVFHPLTREEIAQIVQIMLDELQKRAGAQLRLELCPTKEAVEYLADAGFDKMYGARPVRRAIQTKVEDPLAEKILAGEIRAGDRVVIDCISSENEGKKEKKLTLFSQEFHGNLG